jgi:hypothetical protein
MSAQVTKMPLTLSNGIRLEPTPGATAAAERIRQRLRHSSEGSSDPNDRAYKHRKYLHAQAEIENWLAESASELQSYNAGELNEYLNQRIHEFSVTALQVLEDIISGHLPASIALRAKYASMHLSRAGFPPLTKVTSVTGHLTRDDVEAIKQHHVSAVKEASGEANSTE